MSADFKRDTQSSSGYSHWYAKFDSISVHGRDVAPGRYGVFDSGTTAVVGDHDGVAAFYGEIGGARVYNPKTQAEVWTGMLPLHISASQLPNVLTFIQSLATFMKPFSFPLETRKSGFLLIYLTPTTLSLLILVFVSVLYSKTPNFQAVRWPLLSPMSLTDLWYGTAFWVIGDIWLRNCYTIWDMGTPPRIGFADLASTDASVSQTNARTSLGEL